jgi:hypothetical protein
MGLVATPASAAQTPPADFSFTFSETRPGMPSDADLHILYKDPEHPDDPDGKSPALTKVTIAAPRGTVFDGSAVPTCEASNPELMLIGKAACPPQSNVGGGFGSVVFEVGPPEPQTADVTLFNYGDGIVELLEFVQGGIKAVDRAEFEGKSTMVLHPAVVPGITEREFSFTYHGMPAGAVKPFITTPPRCPARGVWISQLTYTVTTGATYSVRSAQPCRKEAAIRASLTPERVRAGERTQIRVRLRSSKARCITRAKVRLAGRRPALTNHAGRATIVETFHRPGRRTLTASKRGCADDRATLTVLPAR